MVRRVIVTYFSKKKKAGFRGEKKKGKSVRKQKAEGFWTKEKKGGGKQIPRLGKNQGYLLREDPCQFPPSARKRGLKISGWEGRGEHELFLYRENASGKTNVSTFSGDRFWFRGGPRKEGTS